VLPPAFLPALALLLVSCGGGSKDPSLPPLPVAPSIPETCAVRWPPRLAIPTPTPPGQQAGPPLGQAPAPPIAPPRSTLVVHADLPLLALRQALEARVPRRVAEERDHDIGAAGRLEYTVDRGSFSARVDAGVLVVEAPLRGQARACAKGRCYAGCDPEARATARIPLHLGPDYKLRSEDVRVEVTKGCEVRALGGFLKIDVTPVLRSRLAQEAPRIRASIDRELPDLTPRAAQLWAELNKTRALPFGACVVVAPEEIVQGPASGDAELAHLRFGLLARPEVRMRCGEAPRARPLPPLRDDRSLADAGDVHLAMVLAPDAPARSFGGASTIFELGAPGGGPRARIRNATGEPTSRMDLDLVGEACGDVGVSAGGATWRDPSSVSLAGVVLAPGDVERLGSVGVPAAAVARGVEHTSIGVPLPVDKVATVLPELARAAGDEKTEVSARVDAARPEAAGFRGNELLAVVGLRGAVTIRMK